jgi:aspartate racemase
MVGVQKWVPGIVGISLYVDHVYYREIHSAAMDKGGNDKELNRLRTVLCTLDFNELVRNLLNGQRKEAQLQVISTALQVEAAGADFLVITSGTGTTLLSEMSQRISIPVLDLVGVACRQLSNSNARRVGLLSTSQTLAGGLFQKQGAEYGISVIAPRPETMAAVDDVIFRELIFGAVSESALQCLGAAVREFEEMNVDSVILGCTDLTLLAETIANSAGIPLLDVARLHAATAGRVALAGVLNP